MAPPTERPQGYRRRHSTERHSSPNSHTSQRSDRGDAASDSPARDLLLSAAVDHQPSIRTSSQRPWPWQRQAITPSPVERPQTRESQPRSQTVNMFARVEPSTLDRSLDWTRNFFRSLVTSSPRQARPRAASPQRQLPRAWTEEFRRSLQAQPGDEQPTESVAIRGERETRVNIDSPNPLRSMLTTNKADASEISPSESTRETLLSDAHTSDFFTTSDESTGAMSGLGSEGRHEESSDSSQGLNRRQRRYHGGTRGQNSRQSTLLRNEFHAYQNPQSLSSQEEGRPRTLKTPPRRPSNPITQSRIASYYAAKQEHSSTIQDPSREKRGENERPQASATASSSSAQMTIPQPTIRSPRPRVPFAPWIQGQNPPGNITKAMARISRASPGYALASVSPKSIPAEPTAQVQAAAGTIGRYTPSRLHSRRDEHFEPGEKAPTTKSRSTEPEKTSQSSETSAKSATQHSGQNVQEAKRPSKADSKAAEEGD